MKPGTGSVVGTRLWRSARDHTGLNLSDCPHWAPIPIALYKQQGTLERLHLGRGGVVELLSFLWPVTHPPTTMHGR